MNNTELKELLQELDNDIDEQLTEFFKTNPVLKSKFQKLIEIIIWNDGSISDNIINRLDILTDDMDSFNFREVKEDINNLLDDL